MLTKKISKISALCAITLASIHSTSATQQDELEMRFDSQLLARAQLIEQPVLNLDRDYASRAVLFSQKHTNGSRYVSSPFHIVNRELDINVPLLPKTESIGVQLNPLTGSFEKERPFAYETRFRADRIGVSFQNSLLQDTGLIDSVTVQTRTLQPTSYRVVTQKELLPHFEFRTQYDASLNDAKFLLLYSRRW